MLLLHRMLCVQLPQFKISHSKYYFSWYKQKNAQNKKEKMLTIFQYPEITLSTFIHKYLCSTPAVQKEQSISKTF